eukprot:jgi/Tetstr1/428421/TSEL_018435.t1
MIPRLPSDPKLPLDGSAGFEECWGTSASSSSSGSSVLFRLDKHSSVSAVYKGASPHPDSLALLTWLLGFLERFDIELIARHIPGREHTLADCLSRLRVLWTTKNGDSLTPSSTSRTALRPLRRRRLLRLPLGRISLCRALLGGDRQLAHDLAGYRVY